MEKASTLLNYEFVVDEPKLEKKLKNKISQIIKMSIDIQEQITNLINTNSI